MKKLIPIIVVLAFAGIAWAMDPKVDNPLTDIKRKVMRLAGADTKSADLVTIKVNESGHLLESQVMISVSSIITNSKIGNGAAYTVSLPHGTLPPLRKKAGSRITINVNNTTYFLDLIAVSKDSATFRIVEGVENDQG